jgi:acyl dehydratase
MVTVEPAENGLAFGTCPQERQERMMRVLSGADDIRAARGEKLGTSDWVAVTQEQVNQFADATGDHQWIHVDPDRAAQGPFGGTIAHGFLTLSLLPSLNAQTYRFDGVRMAINYGLNKVRFPNPVRVGSLVRSHCELTEVTDIDGGVQLTLLSSVEVEDAPKPGCVAEQLVRLLF